MLRRVRYCHRPTANAKKPRRESARSCYASPCHSCARPSPIATTPPYSGVPRPRAAVSRTGPASSTGRTPLSRPICSAPPCHRGRHGHHVSATCYHTSEDWVNQSTPGQPLRFCKKNPSAFVKSTRDPKQFKSIKNIPLCLLF